MQARQVRSDRFAQFDDAEIVRVERFAARKRGGRLFANERRRDFIRLAEPEWQHRGSSMPAFATSRICDATSERMAARAVGVEGAEADIESISREAPLILRRGEFRQAYPGAAMAVRVATTRVHHMVS